MTEKQMDKLTFEEALEQLEKIVTLLEAENVPLDKMIDYYQKGMELSKRCSDLLQGAEEKMTTILNENNTFAPFEKEEEK